MHYYTHHIGDYKRDTAHLSLMEHGIYRQLIDLYYLTECPLNANALRLIGCRTEDEKKAAMIILDEFFEKTEHGYVQKRCESEINRLYEKSSKARESAKARWNKESDAKNMRTHSEGNADAMLPINPLTHNPINNTTSSDKSDNCPHKEIISIYHDILPTLPKVKQWTDKRQRLLQARWREETKRQDLDYWKRFFEKVSRSDFLMGRTKAPFTCTLEWLVNSSNFVKVIEGNYDNR